MATHSSILAWRIPWTEEPGRLQYLGLQKVRHGWSDLSMQWLRMLNFFHMFIDHYHMILEEIPLDSFVHFKNWVVSLLSCEIYLYILDKCPLSNIWLVKFCYYFMRCILLSWCSLKHSFNFDDIQFIFIFFSFCWFLLLVSYLKNYWLVQSDDGLFLFSSKSFIVLVFKFKPLTHFELKFIYDVG